MATIDDLSVRVSAQTQDFERGMSGAEESLSDVRNSSVTTSAALTALANRVEEVGDELSRTDRQAEDTNRSFAALSAGSAGLNASFMGLSAMTIGTLVPSLVTLSTVIAPLAVVFGGIAAAAASLGAVFGGLALVGVITHMDELQTALSEAREEIMQIIEPLGEVFGPLLVDAVEALPDLVQAIVDSLGPMDEFRNSLINMGNIAMELIPQIAGGMFELAEEALPALNSALEWFVTSGGGAFETMEEVFARVYPLVAQLGETMMDLAPTMLEFGTHVAELVVPALSDMVESMNNIMAAVNSLEPDMQNLITSAVILAPALSVVATVLSSLSLPVIALIGAIGTLAAAFQADFMGIRTAVEGFLPSLEEMQEIATESFESLSEGLENAAEYMEPLTEETVALGEESATSAGIISNSLSPSLDSMQSIVQDNDSAWSTFGDSVRGVLAGVVNYLQTIVLPVWTSIFAAGIAPIINSVASSIGNNFGPVLDEIAQTMDVLAARVNFAGGVLRDLWQVVDGLVVPVLNVLVDIIGTMSGFWIDQLAQGVMFLANVFQGDFGDALGNIENMLRNVMGVGFDLVGILRSSVENAVAWVEGDGAEQFSQISDAILAAFESFPNNLANLFVDAFSGLQSTVNNALGLPWEVSIPGVTVAGQEIYGGGSITVPAFGGDGGGPSGMGGLTEGSVSGSMAARSVGANQPAGSEGSLANRSTQVEVRVEGDTGVIRDVSSEVVDEQNRRQRRESGRTTRIQ